MTYQQLPLIEMKRENMTRNERKEQFLRIINEQGRGGITHRQICNMAGVKKSPYTRNIIIDLIQDGDVTWDEAVTTNQKQVFVFFPTK